MTHFKLFMLKFVVTLVLLGVILGAGFDVSFGNFFLISLVLAAVSYAVVDILLLKNTGNTGSTVADFILAFAVIYFMTDALTVGDNVFSATLIATVSLTIFEYFFHQSVARSLDQEKKEESREDRSIQPSPELRTETSEELFPYDDDDK
ncbi:YndM family protein [Halobacillus litoralis]|uniref:YndM family protein n=1 Tax=Halobacillus litoralis TaxID=45668 RepID=UPI001CD5CFC1|nr:YndM family protein [Halobacillus litoralis]MCA0972072.1 YndM family protein [Halobacillus litoralis]